MRIDLSCPVENRGTIVKTNSETGEQYLLLKLLNISEKVITSVTFNVEAYDANGALIDTLPVVFDELSALPKELFAENKAIPLTEVPEAKNFVINFLKVTFEDEEAYEPSGDNTVFVSNSEASVDDVIALRTLAPDAVCFAQETDSHWKCVCGRPNFVDSESCVRCGRNKSETLTKFSSMETLDSTIAELAAEEEARLAELEKLADEELTAKKEKRKKILTKVCIVIIILAALVGLFFVGRVVYYNIAGNSALKSGDYETAYSYFSKSGSKKINEVTDFVRGNSNSNLLAGGLSAEDEENLYFLAYDNNTYAQNLIKENKKTKETAIMTDAAAGGLCVSKDYVYYIDMDYTVSRITKDGKKIEKVLDKEVTYINLIGNDLYYIQLDYDNPNNLTPEQCQALASQGQMESMYCLHRYNVDTKKDALISKEGMQTCFIGSDKIYFVTDGEDVWESNHLMSMSLDGKDLKTIVDTPVYGAIEKDGFIYYIEVYNSSYKGKDVNSSDLMSCKIIKLNPENGKKEEILPEYMAISINERDGKLYVLYTDRNAYMSYASGESTEIPDYVLSSYDLKTGSTKQLVTGDVYTYNVMKDDIFCIISSSGVCRMKTDGTEFSAVTADGTPAPTVAEESEESEAASGEENAQ